MVKIVFFLSYYIIYPPGPSHLFLCFPGEMDRCTGKMDFEAKVNFCLLVESHMHVGRLKSELPCTEEMVQAWQTRSFHSRPCSFCSVSDVYFHRHQVKTTLESDDRRVAGVVYKVKLSRAKGWT